MRTFTIITTLMGLLLFPVSSVAMADNLDGSPCILPVEVRTTLEEDGLELSKWLVLRDEDVTYFAEATGFQGEADTFWLVKATETGKTYVGVMVHGCLVNSAVFHTDLLAELLLSK